MWNLSGSEIEPVYPALAGRYFTIEPPGKPKCRYICFIFLTSVNSLELVYNILIVDEWVNCGMNKWWRKSPKTWFLFYCFILLKLKVILLSFDKLIYITKPIKLYKWPAKFSVAYPFFSPTTLNRAGPIQGRNFLYETNSALGNSAFNCSCYLSGSHLVFWNCGFCLAGIYVITIA